MENRILSPAWRTLPGCFLFLSLEAAIVQVLVGDSRAPAPGVHFCSACSPRVELKTQRWVSRATGSQEALRQACTLKALIATCITCLTIAE